MYVSDSDKLTDNFYITRYLEPDARIWYCSLLIEVTFLKIEELMND